MNRLLFVVLFLYVQLLGAYQFAGAASVYSNSFSAGDYTLSSDHFSSPQHKNDLKVKRDTGLPGGSSYVVSVDDEDENDDVVSKHVTTFRCILAVSHALLYPGSHRLLISSAFITRHLSFPVSCKYLAGHSLRI